MHFTWTDPLIIPATGLEIWTLKVANKSTFAAQMNLWIYKDFY